MLRQGPNLIVPLCERNLETAVATQQPRVARGVQHCAAGFESSGKWFVGMSTEESQIWGHMLESDGENGMANEAKTGWPI